MAFKNVRKERNDRKDYNNYHHQEQLEPWMMDGKDEEISREEWKPSDGEFQAFMVRDEELAAHNMQQVLKGSDQEMSFRDLRDCLLHSVETVEYVLDRLIKDNVVINNRGRFSLLILGG